MPEITLKDINQAQRKAATRAIKLNKALGLTYYKVRDGKLYAVTPDGKTRFLKEALFGSRKVEKRRIKLKDGH